MGGTPTLINFSLPLTDLHRHLDGNIRIDTIWQLAQQHSIRLPVETLEALKLRVQIQHKEANLVAFLEKMELGVSVLADEQACYRIAYENVQDAKLAGLDYAELRFSPVFMAKEFSLPLEQVVEAVVAGCQAASLKFGIQVNLIGILSRSYAEQSCLHELHALMTAKDNICGLDLAGDEKQFPAKRFVQHFKLARDIGWNITVHAGEADGPDSIWQAIEHLGATRIGHGVAAIEDTKLMDYMAENQIAVECCLTSNFQTGACADLRQHPIKTFLEKDLLVTLNTDDPGVSAIEICDEYQIAADVVGLSKVQLEQIQINGVKASFASDAIKRKLLA